MLIEMFSSRHSYNYGRIAGVCQKCFFSYDKNIIAYNLKIVELFTLHNTSYILFMEINYCNYA